MHIAFADWTFSGVVQDLPSFPPISPIGLAGPRATRAAPSSSASRARRPGPTPPASRLDIARKSAVLVWGNR